MRRSPYYWPAVAGAALLISIAAFKGYLPYVGGRLTIRKPPAVVLSMDQVYLVGMGDRTKLWSLKARKVEIGRDRKVTTLSGISDGKIFDKGKTVLKVRAGRAVYDEPHKDLKLSQGINIAGAEGQRVVTRGAHWNARTALLTSPSRVRVSGQWGDVSGDDLVVDLRNGKMAMRNVSFRVSIRELKREARAKGGT